MEINADHENNKNHEFIEEFLEKTLNSEDALTRGLKAVMAQIISSVKKSISDYVSKIPEDVDITINMDELIDIFRDVLTKCINQLELEKNSCLH